MPTPTEQKALAFLGVIILLGGAVRVVRAGHPTEALPQERQALAHQAAAADSAAAVVAADKGPRTRRTVRMKPAKPGTPPIVVGGVTTVPPYAGHGGFPPPGPRIDIGPAAGRPGRERHPGLPTEPIDLDRASAEDLARLPRIGPALARRILAHRDSVGAFGSMEAFRRVRGVGPATAERLAPLVTFSGRPSSRP